MYTRDLATLRGTDRDVDWGNGKSVRMLVADDDMGFAVCHTTVHAGTESLLAYRNHLESCYCISGSGEIEDMAGKVHRIEPGTIYVLPNHEQHYLRADADADMMLISVFNPPLRGDEKHDLDGDGGSSY